MNPRLGPFLLLCGILLPAFLPGGTASAASGTPDGDGLSDLPLVELRAKAAAPERRELALVASGDGGWAYFIRRVAEGLADSGVSTVGLNSLHYLFHRKSPSVASADLARIMRRYGKAWGRDRFRLVGYSAGADMLPVMINGLPADLRREIVSVTLLGPALTYDLEFHFTEWLWDYHPANRPLLPEAEKLLDIPLLCIYGEEESESLCPSLPKGAAWILPLKGGHHFGGAIGTIVNAVLRSDSTQLVHVPNLTP